MSKLNSATMNSDSEVSADLITRGELKYRKDYQDLVREYHLPTGERAILLKDGFMELGKGTTTTVIGTFLSPSGVGIPAIGMGISTGVEGLGKIGSSVFATDKDLGIAVNPIRDTVFSGNQNNYETVENLVMIGTTIAAQSKYNSFLEKTAESPKKQLESLGIKAEEKSIGLQVDGTTTRGLEIDKALGNNLGSTFKTFDNFKDGVATSVKSIYLDGKTYQTGNGLYYKLNKDLRAIANFKEYRSGIMILNSQNIDTRVLKLVINNQLLSEQQMKNFERLVDSANKMNIKIDAIILK